MIIEGHLFSRENAIEQCIEVCFTKSSLSYPIQFSLSVNVANMKNYTHQSFNPSQVFGLSFILVKSSPVLSSCKAAYLLKFAEKLEMCMLGEQRR